MHLVAINHLNCQQIKGKRLETNAASHSLGNKDYLCQRLDRGPRTCEQTLPSPNASSCQKYCRNLLGLTVGRLQSPPAFPLEARVDAPMHLGEDDGYRGDAVPCPFFPPADRASGELGWTETVVASGPRDGGHGFRPAIARTGVCSRPCPSGWTMGCRTRPTRVSSVSQPKARRGRRRRGSQRDYGGACLARKGFERHSALRAYEVRLVTEALRTWAMVPADAPAEHWLQK